MTTETEQMIQQMVEVFEQFGGSVVCVDGEAQNVEAITIEFEDVEKLVTVVAGIKTNQRLNSALRFNSKQINGHHYLVMEVA